MKPVLYLLLSCLSLGVAAQGLSGRVADRQGTPIAFANIVVLSAQDSTLISGAVSDEGGHFLLEKIERGDLIRASHVGYAPLFVVYKGEQSVTIVLEEESGRLKEVEVKSDLLKTVLRGEGMTTTVTGSILEKNLSMEQLLNLIPGVSALSGKIEVLGRGQPDIYINGRLMRDKMELQRLQPDEIQSVEVITNPGARYAASAKSVLRITTKRRSGEGVSIDSKTEVEMDADKHKTGVESFRINYRQGKWDTGLHLNAAHREGSDDMGLRKITYLEETWEQVSDITETYTGNNLYGRLETSYLWDHDNSAGASISYDERPKEFYTGERVSLATQNGQRTDSSSMQYDLPSGSSDLSLNAYYVGKVGSVGVEFNSDYYRGKRNDRRRNLEQSTRVGEAEQQLEVRSKRDTDNRLWASKLVLSMPLLGGAVSVGGEYSLAKRKYSYSLLPQGLVDDEESRIRESMTSVFVDYGRAFGPLNLQAGVRYEYIDLDYYSRDKYVPAQSKRHGDLFPNIALSLPVGKTQMQLTFASDIHRPSYQQLREGIQYDDRYSYEPGNPLLLPTISQNVSYALSWRWLNFRAMYAHVSNGIITTAEMYKDDPGVSLIRPENIPGYDKAQATLVMSPTIGLWHPSLEVSLMKQWLRMAAPKDAILSDPIGVVELGNTFDTPWVTASVLMTLQTKGSRENRYHHRNYFNTDLSLYKSFMGNRLSLELYVTDLFGTGDEHFILYSGALRSTYYAGSSPSSVMLTLRYRVNTTDSRYKGKGAGLAQRKRM